MGASLEHWRRPGLTGQVRRVAPSPDIRGWARQVSRLGIGPTSHTNQPESAQTSVRPLRCRDLRQPDAHPLRTTFITNIFFLFVSTSSHAGAIATRSPAGEPPVCGGRRPPEPRGEGRSGREVPLLTRDGKCAAGPAVSRGDGERGGGARGRRGRVRGPVAGPAAPRQRQVRGRSGAASDVARRRAVFEPLAWHAGWRSRAGGSAFSARGLRS